MKKEDIIIEIDKLIEESGFYFSIYDFDNAEKKIKEAIKKAKKHELREKVVEGLGELGYYHVKEIGNWNLAIECYEECIKILKGLENKDKAIACYYYRLGRMYHSADWRLQIKYHLKALKYYSFDDDYITKYRIYDELGKAYQSINEFDLSIKNYLKSIKIHSNAHPEIDTEVLWSSTLKELSNTYMSLGDHKKSNEYQLRYDQALEDYKQGKHLKKK